MIGREGDLSIDGNPYLHRHFLRLEHRDGLWWLVNVGVRLAATVSSAGGAVPAPVLLARGAVGGAAQASGEVGLIVLPLRMRRVRRERHAR